MVRDLHQYLDFQFFLNDLNDLLLHILAIFINEIILRKNSLSVINIYH